MPIDPDPSQKLAHPHDAVSSRASASFTLMLHGFIVTELQQLIYLVVSGLYALQYFNHVYKRP